MDIEPERLLERYRELQRYVGWSEDDAVRVAAAGALVAPYFAGLIDDFYAEIHRHPEAAQVITGGAEQIERLKGSLHGWLRELFSGRYDAVYVARRWRVGFRHVQIGLNQVYTNVALSRLRGGLMAALEAAWPGDLSTSLATRKSLNILLDLDLAIIEHAYQSVLVERQQLQLLGTAVRDVKEGVLITDARLDRPGPKIVFVNEALTQITGYPADELIGRTPRIFQSNKTDREVLARLKDQLQKGRPFTAEIVNRRKDGVEYFVELHVSPVFDPAGQITNYVATQRDVTERKRAEDRLLQTERLAAIGEMVTGLAHESRNALQRSKACLELLALEVEDRPDALDLVQRAHKAQDHLYHLYEEVRGYAAPLHLRRQRTNLKDVWRESWAQLETLRSARPATLREEIEGLDLVVELDAFAIGQVFRNIFENALAACTEPCEIVLGCLPMLLDGRPALQVSVVDNGPGLSAEQARRIFEPFYTTKTKGTGLGMAIAKRIVEAHGGQIAVGRRPRRGAEIMLTLPRSAG